MSDKIYIFSTLTAAQNYRIGDGPEEVLIEGGAGIANRNLITPRGVATVITPEQFAELNHNEVFKLHVKNGFITFSDKKADAETVAENMNQNDPSRPDTPERAAEAAAEAQQVTGAEKTTTVAKKK